MKIAVQLHLLPGKSVEDQARWAKDHGVQGIELPLHVAHGIDELKQTAERIVSILPVTTLCGNHTLEWQRGYDFLHPDKVKRRASIDGCKALLKLCGELGAVGQIVPPIFGSAVVPDLSPWKTPLDIEEQLMLAACQELGPFAAAHNTMLLLEPLNRYEQHYLRTQADGARVIRKAKTRGLGLLSDFFHMHIEETDTPRALEKCARYIRHIHLADNTRMEPGSGDIDFVAAFKVLKQQGFKGYMSYECQITGNTGAQREQNLITSLAYIRKCIKKAR